MKQCSKCLQTKPISEFEELSSSPGDYSQWCNICLAGNEIVQQEIILGRYCPNCETKRPIDMFHKNRNRPGGLQPYCKMCRKITRTGKNRPLAANKKLCPGCHKVRLKSAFNYNHTTTDGLQCYCKDCMREQRRIYRKSARYYRRTEKTTCWQCLLKGETRKMKLDGEHWICRTCYFELYPKEYIFGQRYKNRIVL